VRAVVAGVDALLMPPVPDAAFEALQAAVKSGRISKERLDSSVRRILQAKARLGLHSNRLVDVNATNQKFGSVAWQKEAQEISDRGVTLLRHAAPLAARCNKTVPRLVAGVLRGSGAVSGRRSRA
jgi:beta-N-acetylhexosaminidase